MVYLAPGWFKIFLRRKLPAQGTKARVFFIFGRVFYFSLGSAQAQTEGTAAAAAAPPPPPAPAPAVASAAGAVAGAAAIQQ